MSRFYLSLTKQTGKACCHVQFYIFLSIILSIKELSSFSQCHVSGNKNFSSKSFKRGREKDESDQIYIDP